MNITAEPVRKRERSDTSELFASGTPGASGIIDTQTGSRNVRNVRSKESTNVASGVNPAIVDQTQSVSMDQLSNDLQKQKIEGEQKKKKKVRFSKKRKERLYNKYTLEVLGDSTGKTFDDRTNG